MAEQEGVTEQLKATDQVAWVQKMNSIKHRAEEIILSEYVYAVEVRNEFYRRIVLWELDLANSLPYTKGIPQE